MRGKSVWTIVTAVLVAALVAGLTTTAATGAGDSGATAAKKKKKKCPAGTHKVVIKKKNGKKKKKCVPDTVTPTPAPALTATLSISPTASDFGGVQHNGNCFSTPRVDCSVRDFTVTNTGTGASGAPAASINLVNDPNGQPNPPAFDILANTCGALPAGGACTITVGFHPDDSGGGTYISTLDVAASPGGTAQATMTGFAAG